MGSLFAFPDGMDVLPIVDQDYLPTLLKLLSGAKTQIDIISFSFAIGSLGGKYNQNGAPYQIAQKLVELKEKRGAKLKIRFFTEGLRETEGRNRITADFLKKSGVQIRYGSTHAKGFCVDGRYVLFGSTNLTNQSIMKNHEANLLIDDKKVAVEFTKYFDHLWLGGQHGEIKLKKPMIADGGFEKVILDMLKRAEKKIEFSIYFFNHRKIENAMIEAFNRGVKIKGLIHLHASFALPYIWANRSTAKRLKAAGIKDLFFGRNYIFSHSKYVIVDSKEIALGTGNWLVEDVVEHPQLYIHFEDKAASKTLSQHLSRQIKLLK